MLGLLWHGIVGLTIGMGLLLLILTIIPIVHWFKTEQYTWTSLVLLILGLGVLGLYNLFTFLLFLNYDNGFPLMV